MELEEKKFHVLSSQSIGMERPKMMKPTTVKGRVMRLVAQVAAAGPWSNAVESLTCKVAHTYPMNSTVLGFCRHFGAVLIEREGDRFDRVAVFDSGGKMRCYGQDNVSHLCVYYYFVGTIMGQHNDERPVVKLFHRAIRKGDVFFDIGANIGCYTLALAWAVGPTGQVIAFEPRPVF